MQPSFVDRHRTALRVTLGLLTALWLASLYLLPASALSRPRLGLYLLLPLSIGVLILILWYDAWFRRSALSAMTRHLAQAFFWLSAAVLGGSLAALYALFVFQ